MGNAPRPPIDCKPMSARITRLGCRLNRQRAESATKQIRTGVSLYLIPAEDVDRLLNCGRCPRGQIAGAAGYIRRVKSQLRKLWRSTEDMDWWRGDEGVARARMLARRKRWRDKHKTDIAAARQKARARKDTDMATKLTCDGAVPTEMRGELTKAIKARAKAKALQVEAKALNDKANEKIKAILVLAGGKTASYDGIGTVIMKDGTSVKFDKQKLQDYLLKKGVSAKVVGGAMKVATSKSSYESVEFKLP